MKDPRIEKLAHGIINHSCALKEGENVLIEAYDDCTPLVTALVREAYAAGARPYVWLRNNAVNRALYMGLDEEQTKLMADIDSRLMDEMQAYVGIRAITNKSEQNDVPDDRLELWDKLYATPVHDERRCAKTRWCILRYPTPAAAQAAHMSTEVFEDYLLDVCTLDYSRLASAMKPLKALMERTDKVRITGPGTDISFSIKGLPAIPCAGECNLPDGELFTAPVMGSINGKLSFNTPSLFEGFTYENIVLTYENGVRVDATANDTARIRRVFARDEGARGVGEFSFGLNPYVTRPMLDTLFDEKIAGSFHFTPGACYDECPNGNNSAIHWDLVMIQTPLRGGGDIYFDGVLIRHDGRFVLPELEGLNPEKLVD